MREYYDLWPRFSSGLGAPGLVKERVRKTLDSGGGPLPADAERATSLRAVEDGTGSDAALAGVASTVLYPPPPPRAYRCDEYGDYVFMVSRLTPLKRADLLLRALAAPDGRGIRAVIAGEGEERGLPGAARLRAGPRRPRHACRWADRERTARSPGALPRRVLPSGPGRLRIRRPSRRLPRANRSSPAPTAADQRSSSPTASVATSAARLRRRSRRRSAEAWTIEPPQSAWALRRWPT